MRVFVSMLIFVGLLGLVAPLRAEVRGVVEVSGLSPIGISVAPVLGGAARSTELKAHLVAHLKRSHWFSLVPFLGSPPTFGTPPSAPPGANFVVSWDLGTTASGFHLQGLVHSLDGTRQLGKLYQGVLANLEQAVRRFADDIVHELTGVVGTASSTIAFVADYQGHPAIFSVFPDGGGLTRLASGAFECLFPRYGPEGSWLVYTAFPRDFPELMLLDTRRGENSSLSARPGLNSLGAISPDGTQVAATLSFEGNPEVYLLDLSGTVLRRLTKNRASDLSPAWSPNGTQLAFVSDRAGPPAIYVMDSQGKAPPRRLTHSFNSTSYAVEPHWSPNGEYLAFSGRGKGGMDVWVLRLADGEFFRVTEGGGAEEAPEWAPDSRHLVVATRRGRRRTLEVLDVRLPSNRYEIPLPGTMGLRDPTWGQVEADSVSGLPGPGRTP
jgi:TolB protein